MKDSLFLINCSKTGRESSSLPPSFKWSMAEAPFVKKTEEKAAKSTNPTNYGRSEGLPFVLLLKKMASLNVPLTHLELKLTLTY